MREGKDSLVPLETELKSQQRLVDSVNVSWFSFAHLDNYTNPNAFLSLESCLCSQEYFIQVPTPSAIPQLEN